MKILRQSTAETVVLGPFLNSTDGVTAETALTISQADIRLSKEAGTFAQKNDATAAAHLENGYYSCVLNATDTDTLGQLTITVAEAGAIPVRHDFTIVPAMVYDTLVAGTDQMDSQVVAINANAITATSIQSAAITAAKFAAGAIDAAAIATGAIDADALATDAVTEIRDSIFARAFNAELNNLTFEQLVGLMSCVLLAKASGMATTTGTFRNLADNADAVTATQDANGNRTAVTLNAAAVS